MTDRELERYSQHVVQQLQAEIERLREMLDEARLQIEYLGFKFQHTGTSEAVLARITAALRADVGNAVTHPSDGVGGRQ